MPLHLRLKDSINDRLTWLIGFGLAIAPLVLVCALLVASERRHQEQRAEMTARALLSEFEILLDHINGELIQLQQSDASCTARRRQTMQRAAYRLPGVEAFLLADDNQRIYCTSWEPVSPRVQDDQLVIDQGLNISSERRIPVIEQYGILVYRWGGGGYGTLAVISSAALRQMLDRTSRPGDSLILLHAQVDEAIATSDSMPTQELPALVQSNSFKNQVQSLRVNADEQVVRVQSSHRSELSVAYKYQLRSVLQVVSAETGILLVLLLLDGGLATAWILIRRHRLERIEYQITAGLRQGEFEAWFQPVVDMRNGRWVGAEALARWLRNGDVVTAPGEFIAAAEQSGQIRELTQVMAWEACRLLERIKPTDSNFSISINSSPNYLDEQTLAFARDISHHFPVLNSHDLRIEMTESALSNGQRPRLKATLESLCKLGCKLGIDDFGTGQAGLDYLSDMPFHFLKLDRRYVQSIGTDSIDFLLLENIIQLARSLRLHIVAEGVENAEQAQWLMEHEIYHAQGFYYAKPLPADEFLQQGFATHC